MADKATLTLTGKWKKLRHTIDPVRFNNALLSNIEKATRWLALFVKKEIRRRISAKMYSPNATLTVIMKNSSMALVDGSELYNSIVEQIISPTSAFVGVNRKVRTKSGEPLADIAQMLHEGFTIKVTQRMRNMFIVLAQATAHTRSPSTLTGRAKELFDLIKGRGKIHPLKATTNQIVIPARPFLKVVFEDPAVLKKCKQVWENAIDASLKAGA